MLNDVLVKEIIDPYKQERKVSDIEIKMYSSLINKKDTKNDDSDIAKDLYYQLIDTKEDNNDLGLSN